MKTHFPPFLKKGDRIRIVSPAKKLPERALKFAETYLSKQGFEVVIGKSAKKGWNTFAGSDVERLQDFQEALDDKSCRAIFCARGGYGTIRILEQLDFSTFKDAPKWIVGYSDITYLHHYLNTQLGVASIHGIMPLEYDSNPDRIASIEKLMKLLKGENITYEITSHELNLNGDVTGTLVGGNLNILHGVLQAKDLSSVENPILFIEDIGEELYNIDRMLRNLAYRGILQQFNGFIIGDFSNLKDTNNWFGGKSVNKVIFEVLSPLNKPTLMGFPAGHERLHWPLVLGATCKLKVDQKPTLHMLADAIYS